MGNSLEYDYLSMSNLTEFSNIISLNEYAMEINNILEDCRELDIDIVYNEETVPVIKHKLYEDVVYLVEEANLNKLFAYHKQQNDNISIFETLDKLAEHYNINRNQIVVVLDELAYKGKIEYLKNKIKRVRKPEEKRLLKSELFNIMNNIKYFKTSNINCIKTI